ncbi:proline-rich transmembrane protein 1-like [Amphiura filiformis]|uniref:proline-rich transmembrane protein 1-like n=1 Tax=Amphiura filiformis TaxID=82378 RepID=UPI003B221E70
MDTGYYSQNQGYYSSQPKNQGYPQQSYPMYPPGAPGSQNMMRNPQGPPEDYLMFAIFTTVCCCLPLGIVAIIKSLDVRNRFMAGDLAGAHEAAQSSKRWSIAAIVVGIIFNILVPIIVLVVYYTVLRSAIPYY